MVGSVLNISLEKDTAASKNDLEADTDVLCPLCLTLVLPGMKLQILKCMCVCEEPTISHCKGHKPLKPN